MGNRSLERALNLSGTEVDQESSENRYSGLDKEEEVIDSAHTNPYYAPNMASGKDNSIITDCLKSATTPQSTNLERLTEGET